MLPTHIPVRIDEELGHLVAPSNRGRALSEDELKKLVHVLGLGDSAVEYFKRVQKQTLRGKAVAREVDNESHKSS